MARCDEVAAAAAAAARSCCGTELSAVRASCMVVVVGVLMRGW